MIDHTRSMSAPASLAKGTSWRGEDVLTQLRLDFDDKCYLCEGSLKRGWDVEHLRPQAAGGAEYDWKNLFPACHICNIRRKKWGERGIFVDGTHKAWPVGGMLDPADHDNVEQRLRQWLEFGRSRDTLVHFIATQDGDAPAENTAEELTQLHNGSRDDAVLLREWICGRWSLLLRKLSKLQQAPDDLSRRQRTTELRAHLSRKAPYAALMRTRMHRHLEESPELRERLGLDA